MNRTTVAIEDDSFSRTHNRGWINHTGRRLLFNQLAKLEEGELVIIDGKRHSFGRAAERFKHPITLEVHHPAFYGDLAFGGSLGAAESYVAGDWSTSDLAGLVRLMVRNRSVLDGLDGGLALLAGPARRWLHWLNRNSHEGSRRNIAAHYDLGNAFFQLFLDPTLMYSCALFEPPEISLEEASIAKLERICRLLDLKPSDRDWHRLGRLCHPCGTAKWLPCHDHHDFGESVFACPRTHSSAGT